MKKLMSLFITLLLSYSLNAQQSDWTNKYQKKSGNNLLIGGVGIATGSIFLLSSEIIIDKDILSTDDVNSAKLYRKIGFGLIAAGGIFTVIGANQFIKSIPLKKSTAYVGVNENGLCLTLKF